MSIVTDGAALVELLRAEHLTHVLNASPVPEWSSSTFYSYDNPNRDAKIIHVGLDAMAIGRYFPATVGILGDAGAVATQSPDALSGRRAVDAVA
jgi:thiamine pyrophosphate-dependent acetolactate synthase large subunit-like protein